VREWGCSSERKGKTVSRVVCWFSCGAASAVATKLTLQKYRGERDVVIAYCEAIEAILTMIDDEIRVASSEIRRSGFNSAAPRNYQEIRDKIDDGSWKEFANRPTVSGMIGEG